MPSSPADVVTFSPPIYAIPLCRKQYHSPIAVDNYIGTFESVLVLKLYDMPPFLMARLLRRGVSLIEEHLNLIERLNIDERDLKEYLLKRGVSL